jgi:hypothetical protein
MAAVATMVATSDGSSSLRNSQFERACELGAQRNLEKLGRTGQRASSARRGGSAPVRTDTVRVSACRQTDGSGDGHDALTTRPCPSGIRHEGAQNMTTHHTTNTQLAPPAGQTERPIGVAQAPVRNRSRRRALAGMTAALFALLATVGLSPATAGATPISTTYFAVDSEVTCDATFNTVRMVIHNPWVHSAHRGMWVQHQTYLEEIDLLSGAKSGQWGQWSNSYQLWGNWQVLANANGRSDNKMYRLYTQVRYWTTSGWSAPVGNWATPYSMGIKSNGERGPVYTGFCTT